MHKPLNTEDKNAYCNFGVEKENEFLDTVVPKLGLDIRLNPEKHTNKYAPDLLFDGKVADLKTQLVPFFTAGRYGKEPQYTVTFNNKDYLRYIEKYRDIVVFFWVKFTKEIRYGVTINPIEGLWKTDLDVLGRLIEEGKMPLHAYQRRVNDTRGNAKDSYLIDLRDLEEIFCKH